MVFQLGGLGRAYVKRIALWPDNELQHNGLLYVLGDNQAVSMDSQQFGGIKPDWLAGQVKLVLFSLGHNSQFLSDLALQTATDLHTTF